MKKTAKELFAQVNARTAAVEVEPIQPPPPQYVDVSIPSVIVSLYESNGQLLLAADESLGESPLTASGFVGGDRAIIILTSRRHPR